MRRLLLFAVAVVLTAATVAVGSASASTPLCDEFDGTAINASNWHIPTWVSPSDGTYVGRTQFRVAQNSPLPDLSDGSVRITVQTYNPTGFSFYGTDLISNLSFAPGAGVDVIVRAKMEPPEPGGVVGGIFLYVLKPGSSTLHDEIDFELLGNDPSNVHTNIYADEPLGAGHPASAPYAAGDNTDLHAYEIRWSSTQVDWYVDGKLIRTAVSGVPVGPMNLHLNMWAPAADWSEAYSAALQPTASTAANQVYTMAVDSAQVTDPGDSAACSVPVTDATPPVTLALNSSGRRGQTIRLRYRVRDNSGVTRETITIFRNRRPILRRVTGFGAADWARTYYVTWHAPRTGTSFRFCVQSSDRAGNRGNRSCARIYLRR